LGSILTAMVTPFDADGRVDEAAAVRLLHHLLDNGSDGVVVCGTTGEAATMNDDEHLGFIELMVGEARASYPGKSVVAGVGSNDTRHAVELTERATAMRPDALLHVNPYYNRPSRRGIVAHYEAVNRATDLPIVLYNIPQRTGSDMPNDLLAELAQLEHVLAVKQANADNAAKIDGLQIYAGNDDLLATVLDMGEPGGILTGSHVFGNEFRRMVDEPERRQQINASLADVYRDMAVAPGACSCKAALNLIGVEVGGPRLPYVALDESETAVIRALLERHGLLQPVASA
ncbi:MAG TPA: 4-hydroxy-tetrahydrodipicolinate synthase, partial [Solirubrobacteraceae bacterium]|nr:4-hydroxy-tetrahydrodipicolinate synthase [Solirubrobacteraceae bacterium]